MEVPLVGEHAATFEDYTADPALQLEPFALVRAIGELLVDQLALFPSFRGEC